MGKTIIKITTITTKTTEEEEIIAEEITIIEVIEEDIIKTIRVMDDREITTTEEITEAEVIGEETIEEITQTITFLTITTKIMIRMMKLQ